MNKSFKLAIVTLLLTISLSHTAAHHHYEIDITSQNEVIKSGHLNPNFPEFT